LSLSSSASRLVRQFGAFTVSPTRLGCDEYDAAT